MSTTMQAVVVTALTDPLSISVEERPVPTPTPGSVVVQVLATAIADYQRQILTGERNYPLQLPLIPGGNGIGRIAALGPDATSLEAGQLVLVDSYIRVRDNSDLGFLLGFHAGADPATHKLAAGIWRDGTLAEYANVPMENVHMLDEQRLCKELAYSHEDLLTLPSVCIPFGGLDDANVKTGDTVVVAPSTGTFGGAAVLMALAMGANVIACGRNQERLDSLSSSLGSPEALKAVVMTSDVQKDTASIAKAAGRREVDVFIDFSPPELGKGGKAHPHILAALGALRPRGTAVFMGGILGLIEFPYGLVMFKNLVIRGRFMYERDQVVRCIKLAEQGRLKLGKAVGKKTIGPFGLKDIEEALEAAEKNPGFQSIAVVKP